MLPHHLVYILQNLVCGEVWKGWEMTTGEAALVYSGLSLMEESDQGPEDQDGYKNANCVNYFQEVSVSERTSSTVGFQTMCVMP